MHSITSQKAYLTLITVIIAVSVYACRACAVESIDWLHLSSDTGDLEIPNKGTQQTACLVLDIDNDGVNDFVIAEHSKAPSAVWYRRNVNGWLKYIIDETILPIEAGGAFYDIDNDGDSDIVFGSDTLSNQIWWWENPCPNFNTLTPWIRREIKNSGASEHHDQAFGDFDGDGKTELISWNQKDNALLLLEIPANPKTYTGEWQRTVIAQGNSKTEGLTVIDIDLDGKTDIVAAASWYKHLNGTLFEKFPIDGEISQDYLRTAAAQLIPGGRPEVILVPGDANGPLKWYQWNGESWNGHTLIETVIHGHSLAINDINGDGCQDIFVAEMAEPGAGVNCKAWVLYGNCNGNFSAQLISVGVENHESKLGDLDGDGDIDILTKPHRYGTPRVDVWLNLKIPPYISPGDLDKNGWVDFADFAILTLNWLQRDCKEPNWCGGSDIDKNGDVNKNDLEIFAENWLKCPAGHAGDIDRNCRVDLVDLSTIANYWLSTNCMETDNCRNSDIDKNGIVNLYDLEIFAENWLRCYSPYCW